MTNIYCIRKDVSLFDAPAVYEILSDGRVLCYGSLPTQPYYWGIDVDCLRRHTKEISKEEFKSWCMLKELSK